MGSVGAQRIGPGHGVRWVLASAWDAQAKGIIPHGGPAIAILVAGIFVAVVAAIVAMEKRRQPFLWAIIGFIATMVVGTAALALS